MAKKKEEPKVRNYENDNILTTAKVEEILEKERLAQKLQMHERLWFNKLEGVRRKGIKFAMTEKEIEEYIKCKLSVYYFAEHYCKIKLEDGTVGQMKLRDYQKDIIRLYTENRYSILMASRQVGKCCVSSSYINVIDEISGKNFRTTLGSLYFNTLKKYRKLTFLEKIKLLLYNILIFLEKK